MIRALINAIITLFLLAFFFPNISFNDWMTLIVAGFVLTLVNSIIKPILKILTLPINIITLGLVSIVINISLIWLVTWLVPGFAIKPMIIAGIHLGYLSTLLVVSLLIGLTQSVVAVFVGGKK